MVSPWPIYIYTSKNTHVWIYIKVTCWNAPPNLFLTASHQTLHHTLTVQPASPQSLVYSKPISGVLYL